MWHQPWTCPEALGSNLAMRRAMRHRVPRRLSKTDLVAQIGASEDNLEGFASVSSAPGYAPYIPQTVLALEGFLLLFYSNYV